MKPVIAIRAALCLALVSCSAIATNDPTTSEVVAKATREFVTSLTQAERKEFLDARREDLSMFHFGAGSRIRERYFSTRDSELKKAFCDGKSYCDIDDASGIMIVKAWELIRAENAQPTPLPVAVAVQKSRALAIHPVVTDRASEVFEHWEHPDGKPFSIPTIQTAQRGVFLAAIVLFENCRPDHEGNCNADLDIRTIDPKGKIYGEMIDAELWQGKTAPTPGFSQLGVAFMGLKIEPSDQSGTYRVVVTVHDRNSGSSAHAETKFKVN